MIEQKKPESLLHPAHGRIPARKVLECIFALSPDGPILHHHLEEVEVGEDSGTIVYTLNGGPPYPERRLCQIIPPLVPEFSVPD
ncbi:MAG: hypothetical protein QF609_10485 [Gammaproteobacteria bacterium]|jgi:hypothetical protein|nr:hypothetical protein [Gammaproteobacteria bacterium]